MSEEIVPIPSSPTEQELVDAVQQLQRVVAEQQEKITELEENS